MASPLKNIYLECRENGKLFDVVRDGPPKMEFKKSDILDRVKAFLPKIAAANEDLAEKAVELCIETPVDEETYDGRLIEMSFALVKADNFGANDDDHADDDDDSDDDSNDERDDDDGGVKDDDNEGSDKSHRNLDDDDNNSTKSNDITILKDINNKKRKSVGKNRKLVQIIDDNKNEISGNKS